MMPTALGRLHVITDTRRGRDPLTTTAAALEAGAPVIQVRGKDLTDRELYELAAPIADMCRAHGAQCLVNDRLHVAIAVGADGAHVGEHDLPVVAARDVLGPARVLGATLAKDESAELTLDPTRHAYLVATQGPILVNGVRAEARDGVAITGVDKVTITALEEAEIVLVDAR